MSLLKVLTLALGLILIAVSLYLFWLAFILTYNKVENIGWSCPGGGCSPAYNSAGMEIDYPRQIQLNSSEPIKIKTFIYEIEPEKLGCPAPVTPSITLNYEAHLWTSGLELAPTNPQKADNTVDMKTREGTVAEWSWVVSPKEPGTYTLHAELTGKVENCRVSKLSKTFQIQVVDIFGLTAQQISIFAIIGSLITCLVGIITLLTLLKSLLESFKGKRKAKPKKKPKDKNSKEKK